MYLANIFHALILVAGSLSLGGEEPPAPDPVVQDVPAGENTPLARKKCPDCDEAGKSRCPTCGGRGKVTGPCGDCSGTGRVSCPSCVRGQVTCRVCQGSGRKEVVSFGVVRKGQSTWEPCPKTHPCGKCGGTAQQVCSTCRGRKTGLLDCAGCQGKGKQTCVTCGGEAWLVDVEAAQEMERRRFLEKEKREAATVLLGRINALLGEIEKCRSRLADLKVEAGQASQAHKALKAKVEALPGVRSPPSALAADAGGVLERWKDCEESRESWEKLLSRASKLADSSGSQVAKLSLAAREAEEGSSDPAGGDALKEPEEHVREQKQLLDGLQSELDFFSDLLKKCEREALSFDSKARAHEEWVQEESKAVEAKRAAHERFSGRLPKIARARGMPEATSEIVLSESKSSGSLTVMISCFDREIVEPRFGDDVESREELLALVPAFITDVFESSPEIAKIRLRLDGLCLGETGHEERRTLQNFTMERVRWKDLMTGAFKDDWRTVLSKSRPSPPYPRQTSVLPQGWPLLAIFVIAVVGLAILYVLRSKMLLR
jgi:hypothetical protein